VLLHRRPDRTAGVPTGRRDRAVARVPRPRAGGRDLREGDVRAARRHPGRRRHRRAHGVAADAGRRRAAGAGVTVDELVVEFALVRLDHPGLDLEEVAAMVVRRAGPELMLEFAARNLAVRDELRGGAFESAVEYVLRTVLLLRDDGQ